MNNLSLYGIKTNHSPEVFSQILKRQGDIFWREQEKLWVITSYEYARFILSSDNFTCDRSPYFAASMTNFSLEDIQDFYSVISKMMVMSDAPQHTPRRRICYDGFSNITLQKLKPLILKTINSQIELCKKKGCIELVDDFGKVIPSTILADFFHIPQDDRSEFYEWATNMTQFFGCIDQANKQDAHTANNSAINLRNYFVNLVEQREQNPQDDFLSILLRNKQAFQLTNDEIIAQSILMLVAGQVTTTDQMCNNVFTLLSHPYVVSEITPDNIINVIDELNRLDPSVSFIFRLAKTDMCIGDKNVKAGDAIFISSHAVNRDDRVFNHPDQFDFSRKNKKHLSFGFGAHYCIGAKLAQLQMENCFMRLINDFPGLRFSAHDLPVRKHHSLGFSGFERIALEYNR